MELTLEDHHIPRELWEEYGIPTNLNQKKKSKKGSIDFSDDFEDNPDPSPLSSDETVESSADEETIEMEIEQDISMVTGILDSMPSLSHEANEVNETGAKKLIWKGMEFVEEKDEYEGKELVILKAQSGEFDPPSFLSFFDLLPHRSRALYFHGLNGRDQGAIK
jgi:hypothetical protein